MAEITNPPLMTKKERTRGALIAAASAVIDEQGVGAASLDAIARRAGMTKGAIYSNFASRTELLMAVRNSRAPMLRPPFEPGAPLKRQLTILAESLIAALPTMQSEYRFVIDYYAHVEDDPDFRSAITERYAAMFDLGAKLIGTVPDKLKIPPRELMVMVQSLSLGFVYQSYLTPHEVEPATVLRAFEALADGVVDA